MALGGTYSTGTISVSADGTVVTGAGTLWSSVAEQGDWLFANGNIGIIASVDDDTQLTLYDPWTGGALVAASYRVVKMSWLRYDPALTQAKLRDLVAALDTPTIIYGVDGAPPIRASVRTGNTRSNRTPASGNFGSNRAAHGSCKAVPLACPGSGRGAPLRHTPATVQSRASARPMSPRPPTLTRRRNRIERLGPGCVQGQRWQSRRHLDPLCFRRCIAGRIRSGRWQASSGPSNPEYRHRHRADLLDATGATLTGLLDQLDASTSTVKAQLSLTREFDPRRFIYFNLTACAAPAGYRNLTVSVTAASSENPFEDGDIVLLGVVRVGRQRRDR